MKVRFLPLLILVSLVSLHGEDIESALKSLKDKALAVNIATRVLEKDQVTVWHTESSKVTISGKAVSLKLSGDNVLILADITPYMNVDGTLLLVAQGEVYITSSPDGGVKYYSTMKSVPVKAGEKVIFFPLGVAFDADENVYTIEVEIEVLPYSEMIRRKEGITDGSR